MENVSESVDAGADRRGALAWVREWLFRGEAIRQAGAQGGPPNPEQQALYDRARSLAAVARVLSDDVEGPDPAAHFLPILRLYREAAACLLAARPGAPPVDPPALEGVGRSDGTAPSREELARDQARVRAFVEALLERVGSQGDPVAQVRRERTGRWLATAFALVGVVELGLVAKAQYPRWKLNRDRPDHAPTAHWHLSSVVEAWSPSEGVGFTPCGVGELSGYFFHTNMDDSPWIEFDLGQSLNVSYVSVTNREDCCHEVSVPLVVEVSYDEDEWVEVASISTPFEVWTAEFPRQTARYVRFRVTRKTWMHLASVEIR